MAATAEASRLTEAHRLAQARLGGRAALLSLATWSLLDLRDLDRTARRWLAVMVPLVEANRRLSATLAANYLSTFRSLELGVQEPPIVPVLADVVPVEEITTSLLVTGPVGVKTRVGAGMSLQRASELSKTDMARAAMREVLNGGRDTIARTVTADKRALGWARATSGKACAFCAMIAARGPVFREDTVHFEAHNGCSCTAEPVYRRDADWPAGSRQYQQLWNESTRGLHTAEARNAFRRALEAQQA